MLKVAKFGGSSLADAVQYRKVKDIIERDPARTVVVVSAPGKRTSDDHKITDLLYLCEAHLKYGVSFDDIYEMICTRYITIRNDLGLKVDLETEFAELRREMRHGISRDEIVSRGEYFSARLMAAYLGYEFIDAKLWLTFNLDGTVDTEKSYELLRIAAEGRKVVIPGFYGVMPDGHIRLMDRGGSDITGALAAAALDADVYENWTDVSGILMADPRIVPNAKTIDRVTYSELRELSYIGAQVLHEASIFPVRRKNIPLNIRNTNEPDHPGTMIQEYFTEELPDSSFITGLAGRKGFSIITITKSGMSSKVDSLRRIVEIFEKYNVTISYAPTGIDCFSAVVENQQLDSRKYAVLAELQKELKPDDITVTEQIAVLAVVGRRMISRSGSSGRIFEALGENGINIRMISQGPEELNIIIGVKEADFNPAIRVIYENFVD
ncbi:MAG: aspartate kinase [Lachnospiraceae bacterium]|nr:aspartate kinase [Lachnospiraceae bacterium]